MNSKLVILISGLLVCSSALAEIQHPTHGRYSTEASVVTLNDNLADIKNISDIDLGYKVSIKDSFTPTFYGSLDVEKYNGSDIGFGAVIGAHAYQGLFRPFAEVIYTRNPNSIVLSDSNIGYDIGFEFDHFKRATPYVEGYDFADTNKKYIVTGVKVDITNKLYVFSSYHFKSRQKGTAAEIGAGYCFS